MINKIVKVIIILILLFFLMKFGISTLNLKNIYKENLENQQLRIPYVNQDLKSGSMINSTMVNVETYLTKDIPKGDYYLNTIDVIGKCVSYDVNKSSLFYKDMLVECDEITEEIEED